MTNETTRNTIAGWVDKASNHLATAREHATSSYRSSEAVQAAQECVELSVKSVLSLLQVRYPPAHQWPADGKACADIARQIQQRDLLGRLQAHHLNHTVRLPRLLLLLNFWAQFYLVAKYGFEVEHLAASRDLFDRADAALAVEHADECWRAATALLNLDREQLSTLISGDSALT